MAVAQCAVERKPGLFDVEVDTLTAETGLPDLDLKRLSGESKLCAWIIQPPCSAV